MTMIAKRVEYQNNIEVSLSKLDIKEFIIDNMPLQATRTSEDLFEWYKITFLYSTQARFRENFSIRNFDLMAGMKEACEMVLVSVL